MPTAQINALLEAVPLPLLVVDREEWIIAANTEATRLLGAGIVGRHFANVLRQPEVIAAIEATLKDGQEHLARHRVNQGAQDAPLDVTCRAVEGIAPGARGAVVITFQDRADMEQAGQMRRDFVANVSHELRTPLTSLIGFIETLRGAARDDPGARDRFLSIMESEAGRMNRLVGDLLSLSRVEAEERVRPTRPLDMTALLSSVLTSLARVAKDSGVTLSLDAPHTPVMIPGDDDQLRQVFNNLVENAIKYGGSGGSVSVAVRLIERDPLLRGEAVEIRVIDKGPGIDDIHLPRLTERFYRVDSHRSRQLGGTGLGLAIAKHIVNRHRGRLKIASELGKGTTFIVVLPR
ncbi:ATP-binding protein [Sedimentitalea arenosa]|uniref:histidine kinase n=1 Tax=Sedimentitalea arenosa TaxID=2798803 RepID=A0A8J7LR89_9RHOB|nr:ATP-binding protein [Arenibacterium arenosum]MBJ6371713.1 two-component sensor histidine kinase [Arenibacterium arenosum]